MAAGKSIEMSVPLGTQDCHPLQMRIRNKCIEEIKKSFTIHGAMEIDTPVFEKREILMSKSSDTGESETKKLVFDLMDQGGQMLTMRYDLTVPLARYAAQHNIFKMKRYQIGKVYRRDNPSIAKGRLREFSQADVHW